MEVENFDRKWEASPTYVELPFNSKDYQVQQRAVISSSYDASALEVPFKETKVRLCLDFIESKIVHEGRNRNKPTHILASMGVYDCLSQADISMFGQIVSQVM